ncbi:MAG: hypothetical protein BGO20_17690 [Bosea sp. 67-29]|nr:MAG: hypothetical protein BGO20_17690 [Bosea sp. 67-29]
MVQHERGHADELGHALGDAGSGIRTTGSSAGNWLRSNWSTPAPTENTIFRFGKVSTIRSGGCKSSRCSTAAGSPTSGQIRNGTSGACPAKAAAHYPARSALAL